MKIIFLLTALLVSGCATYQGRVSPARDMLAAGNCEGSLKLLEEMANKEDGDQLVHLMDYAAALQICGDYKKSNQVFDKAEKVGGQADYHSASRVVGATLLNEEMIQYKGDTFELLFLNVEQALNFLQLGRYDDALVEVRKMNQKFVKLKGEDKRSFELNSFSKYLSGLIWEASKKYDDACIDFKDAYAIDPFYRKVGLDALRTCWKARRTDEFNEFAKKLGATTDEIKAAKESNKSELILIYSQGWGPRKQPRPENHLFPHLVPVSSQTQFIRADLLDGNRNVVKSFTTEPVYSVEKAAIETLNADYGSLVARRIAARAAKEIVADQVRQKDKLAGNLMWLAMVVSERADLRQWSIFPRTFQVVRIPLNPGQQTFNLTGLDGSMNSSEKMSDLNITINGGEKRFQLVRTLR
ncbi:MAG: hypothetical protein H7256_11185 [Bdellovibrio sp.]|nr:hypothetical protein [Bdellovibrio sp.]